MRLHRNTVTSIAVTAATVLNIFWSQVGLAQKPSANPVIAPDSQQTEFFESNIDPQAIASNHQEVGLQSVDETFNVTPNNNSADLLATLFNNTNGLNNLTVTTTGDPRAFGIFKNDPFGLGSGVVLSTGQVVTVVGPNRFEGASSDLKPLRDLAQIDIDFDADSTADKLLFQYVFGSEEFLEFSGSTFNDFFTLELNGVNLALLSNGKEVTINNLAQSRRGPFDPAFVDNTDGIATDETELDGFTKTLLFEGTLRKNTRNNLRIKIMDVGDDFYDSAVFIKGGIRTVSIPEATSLLGLLTIVSVVAIRSRFKKQKDQLK